MIKHMEVSLDTAEARKTFSKLSAPVLSVQEKVLEYVLTLKEYRYFKFVLDNGTCVFVSRLIVDNANPLAKAESRLIFWVEKER